MVQIHQCWYTERWGFSRRRFAGVSLSLSTPPKTKMTIEKWTRIEDASPIKKMVIYQRSPCITIRGCKIPEIDPVHEWRGGGISSAPTTGPPGPKNPWLRRLTLTFTTQNTPILSEVKQLNVMSSWYFNWVIISTQKTIRSHNYCTSFQVNPNQKKRHANSASQTPVPCFLSRPLVQPWPFRVLLTLGLAFFFPSGVRLSEQRKKSGMFGFMANQPNPPKRTPLRKKVSIFGLMKENQWFICV